MINDNTVKEKQTTIKCILYHMNRRIDPIIGEIFSPNLAFCPVGDIILAYSLTCLTIIHESLLKAVQGPGIPLDFSNSTLEPIEYHHTSVFCVEPSIYVVGLFDLHSPPQYLPDHDILIGVYPVAVLPVCSSSFIGLFF